VVVVTERVIRQLYSLTGKRSITGADVHLELRNADMSGEEEFDDSLGSIRTRRTDGQGARCEPAQVPVDAIREFDISFGIGPAGTGKTYLAVASAVAALDSDSVRRICLVRPAVEAGERLGFLPGDMSQKIDPYLRPLYDALYEMLGFERVAKLIERNIIEVAPLAFMRGRTLNESFIILDEAQNTTVEQMKMFLTRIGFGSKAVVTGDVTQVDLPRNVQSGLRQVLQVLKDEESIGMTFFNARDVVRHPLVQRIVNAYARYEQDNPS
jgi:phosphate starvation-inducible PhoH-like protein